MSLENLFITSSPFCVFQAGCGGGAPLDRQDDDMIYADSDYKDLYDFGPVAYHNASKTAAIKKKEELDARFKAALQYNSRP